ncbi:MAG: dephospho-CoA kinase [Bellilinea sp.]
MSRWEGKYVIGLTGNIATGKSVVRRMLEHLGAYGIDADALAHRTIARGAPGYQAVVDQFGKWIVNSDGEIDRGRLGRVVFSDPQALASLETIIHPLVDQVIDFLVKRAPQPVIVIEAIKLLEANLSKKCDSIWVAYAPKDVQLARLTQKRRMSRAEAIQRIEAQPSQQQKVKAAKVVINNVGSIEDTWKQVVTGWRKDVPAVKAAAIANKEAPVVEGQYTISRGKPGDSAEITTLINHVENRRDPLTVHDIMEGFSEKAYLLLHVDSTLKAVAGWQVENLVSRTTELVIDPALPFDQVIPALIREMERASRELQCEVSMVFTPPKLGRLEPLWQDLGYVPMKPESLVVRAWKDAARESMPPETLLLFKKLREDRVIRPI